MSAEDDNEVPLVAHLRELRSRLIWCLLTVMVVFAGLFHYSDQIYTLISAPLRAYLPEGASMIATGVASPFLTPFKLTAWVALFASIPVILFQAWGFIAPGLYRKERKVALPLLLSSIVLFYAGMAFAYFVVFPVMFHFFASATPQGVAMMTDINQYLDFILALFFAFGVTFEIPVATCLLIWIGVMDVPALKRSRPYVIVGCFVVGMILTPPDPLSQTLLAVPMWLLFEVGLLCGSLIRRHSPSEDESASKPPVPR